MERNPDKYLDSREFQPSQMEALVRERLRAEQGGEPERLSGRELTAGWELLLNKKKTRTLSVCRGVLAAACLLFTIGLAAALLRPVPVQGGNTYITFTAGDGSEEQFVFYYREVDAPYGRSHRYQSFEELQAAVGISLAAPEGQRTEGIYLESGAGSSLYCVTAYFADGQAVGGYQAYLVEKGEEAYSREYQVSHNWKRLSQEILSGREITLYRTDGGRYGAAFAEKGIVYVMMSGQGTGLEAFKEALASLS